MPRSCADIFADAGNPWITERDRLEMPMMVPSKAHVKRLQKGDRVDFRDPPKRIEPETDRTRALRHQLSVRNGIIAALGGSRTVAASGVPADVIVMRVQAPSKTELGQ